MLFLKFIHNFTHHLLLLRRIETLNPSSTLMIIENMQSNLPSKSPRRSFVRSVLQRITKKKDTEKQYPAFLDASAIPDMCPEHPDFFIGMHDRNDDSISADK
ncbi:uncharacterized protein BJ212DRAFT_1342820 [Suillus subaureus]|uniref:Uncharacterized protein n=1 Tax=Suillus subaureus TaxID=48587 RepID=A0A9P7EF21_9AGAM|nr:uncharacterized protein BJ212DRAFT_1342820 [Suillus subaureus]KAG1819750.1 hypothetical protein BJ212DRAFT_1342820 [Suillus subaureus]